MSLHKIQEYEDKMISNAQKGVFRYDLFEQMMTTTTKLFEIDRQMVFEEPEITYAKRLKKEAPKVYRSFPTDKPDREILDSVEIGQGFYIKLYGNYTLALMQAKIINCVNSYNKIHKVKWIFNTHRVFNELKVTRVG